MLGNKSSAHIYLYMGWKWDKPPCLWMIVLELVERSCRLPDQPALYRPELMDRTTANGAGGFCPSSAVRRLFMPTQPISMWQPGAA